MLLVSLLSSGIVAVLTEFVKRLFLLLVTYICFALLFKPRAPLPPGEFGRDFIS